LEAMSVKVNHIFFPPIKVVINDTDFKMFSGTEKDEGYSDMLYSGYNQIKSITIIPLLEPDDEIMVRGVILNTLKLNSPEGWNVTNDEGVELLVNTYFMMSYGSKIRFEKPEKSNR
jgi:hypothetical protein